MVITDADTILQIMHKNKNILLKSLFSQPKTIQELNHETGINPGTIKRLLDKLIQFNLVIVKETRRNFFNIKMKYYTTSAKKFLIDFVLS